MRSWGTPSHDRLDAVAVDPVGVLAAAGEAPPAGRAVAVAGGGDRAGRAEHAGRDDVGRAGEQFVEGRAGQAGKVAPRARSDHHGPAHRGVGPGERLEHPHGVRQSGAGAAVSGRSQQAEHPGRDQLVEQVARYPAAGLDLVGANGDRGRQAIRGVEDVACGRDVGVGGCGHGLLRSRVRRPSETSVTPGPGARFGRTAQSACPRRVGDSTHGRVRRARCSYAYAGRRGARRDAELGEDVAHVPVHRPLAEHELGGDRLVASRPSPPAAAPGARGRVSPCAVAPAPADATRRASRRSPRRAARSSLACGVAARARRSRRRPSDAAGQADQDPRARGLVRRVELLPDAAQRGGARRAPLRADRPPASSTAPARLRGAGRAASFAPWRPAISSSSSHALRAPSSSPAASMISTYAGRSRARASRPPVASDDARGSRRRGVDVRPARVAAARAPAAAPNRAGWPRGSASSASAKSPRSRWTSPWR